MGSRPARQAAPGGAVSARPGTAAGLGSFMTQRVPLNLFEAFGVELEYMIVDASTLHARPLADRVLGQVAGRYVSEREWGRIAWSNELALHVIELKTQGPASSLSPLPGLFQEHVRRVNARLQPAGARLMPTAMHPWMDPRRELRLWPHDDHRIYETYDRIFDCRRHGWANLQSVHLNLPFADDGQFGALHAAIRLLLPLLPALAASSPIADGHLTGRADYRLHVYRHNADRVSQVAGAVIPEPAYSRADYERLILEPLYDAIAPWDPDAVLRHEWLNARGAIARFDRQTIEIRVLDVQECPAADLAVCQAVVAVLQALVGQRWTELRRQQRFPTHVLADVLQTTARDAERAVLGDRQYLTHFGLSRRCTAREAWQHLVGALDLDCPPMRMILEQGPLARRIERALRGNTSRLPVVYRQLCECLASGHLFAAD
jgi:gamma-glutamyl:cysteine ligase YbdK (ATP-grasp superfamily)